MKARDRHSRILAALAREGRVSVTELARDHDVTVETIRRDLAVLDRAGALRKIHGGALPAPVLAAPETGVLQRERDHAEAKARIARAALAASGFTVQLEVRRSEVSEHADVVLPVAPAVEKNGTFVNWEGRVRPFGQAHVSRSRTDRQVLGMLADEMGVDLQVDDLVVLHEQLADLGLWRGQRPSVAFGPAPAVCAGAPVPADDGVEARLTTHKPMLDAGRLQDGEPFLAATALRPIARVGTDLAQRLSLAAGQEVTVATAAGSITLPAVVGGVSDGTVWLPECSAGSTVHQTLGAGHGSQVTVTHAAEVLR